MRETDAELAGEMSGHFFFKERWYGFDDGIYAAARLLEILASRSRDRRQRSARRAARRRVARRRSRSMRRTAIRTRSSSAFRNARKFEGARLSTIDGLRVDWPDGWGLVRASNTTPVLVMRFDADSTRRARAHPGGVPRAVARGAGRISCCRSERSRRCVISAARNARRLPGVAGDRRRGRVSAPAAVGAAAACFNSR